MLAHPPNLSSESAAGCLLQVSPGPLYHKAGFAITAQVSKTQHCPAIPRPGLQSDETHLFVFNKI